MNSYKNRRLCIIPARGGSKRIPHKNLRTFCGKPIIGYSIECAEASNLFDKIHISTDEIKISNIATDFGHTPEFVRPPDLANDHTPLMPVLRFVLEQYENMGEVFNQVILLMACAPLVLPEDLHGAINLANLTPSASGVISVCKFPAPIARSYTMISNNFLDPNFPKEMPKRSQDLPENYYDAGQFYLFPASVIKESIDAGNYNNFVGYELPSQRAVDIDTEDDWLLAEILYNNQAVSKHPTKKRN